MELWELQIQKRGPGFSDLDQGQLQIIYYLVSFSSSEVKVQDKREYGSSALLLWPVLWDVAAFPALCQPFPQVWIGGWASKTVRTDRRGTSTNAMVQCFSLCCRTGDRENIPTEREREWAKESMLGKHSNSFHISSNRAVKCGGKKHISLLMKTINIMRNRSVLYCGYCISLGK